jgi:hypothetical protein
MMIKHRVLLARIGANPSAKPEVERGCRYRDYDEIHCRISLLNSSGLMSDAAEGNLLVKHRFVPTAEATETAHHDLA